MIKKQLFIAAVLFCGASGLSAQQVDVMNDRNVEFETETEFIDELSSISPTNLGNVSGFVGTNANHIPLVFRVNNILAGFTGSSSSNNAAFGFEALSNNAGSSNTAFGVRALHSNATGGFRNTAVGLEALRSNMTGTDNTAVGANALRNSRGTFNTATGSFALEANTSGFRNTAFGATALRHSTTSSNNTAVGERALQFNTTGNSNTAIGATALSSNRTGSFNTAVGNNASVWSDMSNATAIGNGAIANASNQVRIGNSSVNSIGGQVGWSNLSDGRVKTNIRTNVVPGLEFINRLQPVTYNMDLDAADTLMGIDRLMEIDRAERNEDDSFESAMSQEQLEIIEQAREVRQRQVNTGFIAQDVAEAARSINYDFSGVDIDEMGIYSLRYAEFVVPLVQAVQELSTQNDTQNDIIALQQRQIEDLQRQIDDMRNPGILRPFSAEAEFNAIPNEVTSVAVLHQNVPNPFSQSTQIQYYLPENVRNASLIIFDMTGKQLMQIPLTQRGEGVELIQGSQLAPGIYLYALIADGREVDVKRMILTQ